MYRKDNNMRKKIAAVSVLTAMALSLAACGDAGASVEDEVSQALSENAEKDQAQTETAEEETVDEEAETSEETVEETADLADAEAEDTSMDTVEMIVTEADDQGNDESENESTAEYEEDGVLQIVFLGDSIFDSVRDDTGIAHLVSQNLNADVYNLAIGGTTAALRKDKSTDLATWSEPTFDGVVYEMTGQLDHDILSGYKSGEVMETLNPEYTDYFIVEYGTNDFLSYIPLGGDDPSQYYFYFRTALDNGLDMLQEYYPDAQIIVCSPYYEEYWSADRTRFIGDVHSVNNGYGTLLDYISVLGDSAEDHNTAFLNMYNLLGISQENVNDMTVDGIHPSEETRNKYADILTDTIKAIEDGSYEQESYK